MVSPVGDTLLELVQRAHGGRGRLHLLLGQAGNRSDEAIGELAATAAAFAPDHIVLKDMAGYQRGRESGAVAGASINGATAG